MLLASDLFTLFKKIFSIHLLFIKINQSQNNLVYKHILARLDPSLARSNSIIRTNGQRASQHSIIRIRSGCPSHFLLSEQPLRSCSYMLRTLLSSSSTVRTFQLRRPDRLVVPSGHITQWNEFPIV